MFNEKRIKFESEAKEMHFGCDGQKKGWKCMYLEIHNLQLPRIMCVDKVSSYGKNGGVIGCE